MSTRNDGQRLAQARREAGYSLDDVLFEVRTKLPRSMWISRATIARMEKQEEVDAVMVAFLANLYGANLAEFFPEARGEANTLRDLLISVIGCLRKMAASDVGGVLDVQLPLEFGGVELLAVKA